MSSEPQPIVSPRASVSRAASPQTTFLAWNALLLPFVPALGAYTLWRRYGQKKSADSLRGQWGYVPRKVVQSLEGGSPRIWMHAVSVGETLAARPVARELKQMAGCKIALSVTTDTGYEAAQAALKAGEVDGVFYFPLDLSFVVHRVLDLIRPDVFLTMETELWPNVLHAAKRRGAQTFLVNGRVSDNMQRRAPQLGRVWRWMLSNIDMFLMRSELDAARIRSLGVPSENVKVTGDVKLDAMAGVENVSALRAQWRRALQIPDNTSFFVAGSTHAGEEETVLRVWKRLREDFPGLRVLVAPRHIERVPEVLEVARSLNIKAACRSEQRNGDVVILDTIGELSQIYAAADVAFVGGSLIERGGHNMLEPVLCGVPVAFGPHIANFRAAAQLVEEAQAGRLVRDENELEKTLRLWLRDGVWRQGVAERAQKTLEPHRGASIRVAQIVAEALESTT